MALGMEAESESESYGVTIAGHPGAGLSPGRLMPGLHGTCIQHLVLCASHKQELATCCWSPHSKTSGLFPQVCFDFCLPDGLG